LFGGELHHRQRAGRQQMQTMTSPHWGLNPGPSVYKTDALPLSYRGCDAPRGHFDAAEHDADARRGLARTASRSRISGASLADFRGEPPPPFCKAGGHTQNDAAARLGQTPTASRGRISGASPRPILFGRAATHRIAITQNNASGVVIGASSENFGYVSCCRWAHCCVCPIYRLTCTLTKNCFRLVLAHARVDIRKMRAVWTASGVPTTCAVGRGFRDAR
jgi:hypothetical protein